jgi:predicted metalloprotease with PDZ domain
MRTCLPAIWLLLGLSWHAGAQAPVQYRLRYDAPGGARVSVEMVLPSGVPGPVHLVMPRAIPGGYAQQEYDRYVRDVRAYAPEDRPVEVAREDGPRWRLGGTGDRVVRIEYAVDVTDMEREIFGASDTSKIRAGYAGLLGYSVFGYVEGFDDLPVRLQVDAPPGWPAFTTLAPQAPPATDHTSAMATSFYALADSQVVLGPRAAFRRVQGDFPLYLVVYAETEEDLDLEGELARKALDDVVAYFGSPPFAHYTVYEELLQPLSPRHEYGFSMEHLESGTFFLGVDRAITASAQESLKQTNLFNYAHHMAHSWVPKHAYGIHYFPHRWEIAPIIDTVWFNEGFGRYAAIEAVADSLPPADGAAFRANSLARLRAIVDGAPPVIRRMSLVELSRVASVLYSEDFRTGMNTFARGGLMADDMDRRIRERSGGRYRLRDVLRFMPGWIRKTGRGFQVDEFPDIVREATDVDVSDIFERWLAPPLNAGP